MRQSAAAASPTLFEFAVLFISFCLRPLLPTRKLQNRNEFPPGKPNKRNRLFPLGSFESNKLWNTTYFRARRLGTFIPGSWRIAARIMSLQYFLFGALTRKKIPLLTALPGSSIKIIRDLRKPHAALNLFECFCLNAFVIAAFQLVNICHRVKSCMNLKWAVFKIECFIHLKSSAWFTLGSENETMLCDTWNLFQVDCRSRFSKH